MSKRDKSNGIRMRLFTSSEPVRGQSVAAWPTLSVWGGRGREQVQKGGGPAGTLFVRVQFLRLVDAGRRLLFFCITLEFPLFLLGGRGQRHGRKRRRVLLGRPAFSLQLTIDSIFVCVMNMGSPVKFLHSTRPQPRHTLADTHTHTHTLRRIMLHRTDTQTKKEHPHWHQLTQMLIYDIS